VDAPQDLIDISDGEFSVRNVIDFDSTTEELAEFLQAVDEAAHGLRRCRLGLVEKVTEQLHQRSCNHEAPLVMFHPFDHTQPLQIPHSGFRLFVALGSAATRKVEELVIRQVRSGLLQQFAEQRRMARTKPEKVTRIDFHVTMEGLVA